MADGQGRALCPGSIPGDPLFLSFFVPSCKRHPAPNGCLYFMRIEVTPWQERQIREYSRQKQCSMMEKN